MFPNAFFFLSGTICLTSAGYPLVFRQEYKRCVSFPYQNAVQFCGNPDFGTNQSKYDIQPPGNWTAQLYWIFSSVQTFYFILFSKFENVVLDKKSFIFK